MTFAGFSFSPRLVPTVAAAAMLALLLSLGRWQSDRVEEKTRLQALLEARMAERPLTLTGMAQSADDLRYRQIRVAGRYLASGQIFIDNRIHEGRAGFHVVTPLEIAGGKALILVNRGWVARTAAYPAPPEVPVPTGELVVEGLATEPPRRVLELSADTISGNVWQNLVITRYAEHSKRPVLPVVLVPGTAAPGLVTVTEKPDAGIDKHREYALTWYSLAVTVVALWIGLNLRRARP